MSDEQTPSPKDKYPSGNVAVSGPDGFWRAARQWSEEPTIVPLDELTDDQVLLLEGDAAITITDAGAPGDGRLQSIIEAIDGLEQHHPEKWTTTGAPQVKALEEVLGFGITSAERDAAWAEYRAE